MRMSEGTIYQRGPEGQVPNGMSVNGVEGAYGEINLRGPQSNEHITVFGDGWHRSWDNPGTRNDHPTQH